MNIHYYIEIRANRKFAIVDHRRNRDLQVYMTFDDCMARFEDIASDEALIVARVMKEVTPAGSSSPVRYVAFD